MKILTGDALEQLKSLPDCCVQTCVTSPPYWGLREYGMSGQLGQESTPEEYTAKLVEVFREVRRILCRDGTLWLVIGDCYATGGGAVGRCPGGGEQGARFLRQGHINTQVNRMPIPGLKPKDLVGIPWRVAFALQADGWWLRSDIIWSKPNPNPESVRDRPSKSHEYIFLFSKMARYYYDAEAISEAAQYGKQHAAKATSWGTNRKHPNKTNVANYSFVGENHTCHRAADGRYIRNSRSVWNIATRPTKLKHSATYPEELPRRCILAGSKEGDTVLDPFLGTGTTLAVAKSLGRDGIGIELNLEYVEMAEKRILGKTGSLFAIKENNQ